jgi:uncharacterized protein (TIGR02594 family)
LAARFLGLKERPGKGSNPIILGMLQYAGTWPTDDDVPWCSAFIWSIAYLLDLPRPHTAALAARSWLAVGTPVALTNAVRGFDVVVLERGGSPTAGHVGLYHSHSSLTVSLLAGNQGDQVSVQAFDRARVLGVRRLA